MSSTGRLWSCNAVCLTLLGASRAHFVAPNRKLDCPMNDLYASERKAPSLAPQMSIVYRVIDQLKPDPASPRRHSERRIRNTINALGFGARIRCHRDADVIAGRRRRRAAGALR